MCKSKEQVGPPAPVKSRQRRAEVKSINDLLQHYCNVGTVAVYAPDDGDGIVECVYLSDERGGQTIVLAARGRKETIDGDWRIVEVRDGDCSELDDLLREL